ncbi:MAG: DUF192 domain-containing protein [Syntrophorhabdaceae bacterium]|nr:DUF192 domain-containing protein [Syntrophorhabdaceae bacterium]
MVKCPFYIKALFFFLVLFAGTENVHSEERVVSFLDRNGNKRCSFIVELATTPEEHARGLMFRRSLCDSCGMLFIFEGEELRSFWMKNTYIPLDMIFIDAHLKVVHIEKNAKPLDERPIPSVKPSKYVLEIKGGKTKKCGITVGGAVKFSNIPGF